MTTINQNSPPFASLEEEAAYWDTHSFEEQWNNGKSAMVVNGKKYVSTRETLVLRALDNLGAALRQQGETAESLTIAGRDERGAILKELYGIEENSHGFGTPMT